MGDEMFGDEIALGNHVLHVGSPIGEGRADDFGCLAHASGPSGAPGQRRVVIDELWVEIAVNGCQVTIREQQ
jgi:hypothetical protein